MFGAGTVQWAWGLDDSNPNGTPANKTMRQATVNLFADMGVQPATLRDDLSPATASTDTQAPVASITDVPSTVNDGQQVTIAARRPTVAAAWSAAWRSPLTAARRGIRRRVGRRAGPTRGVAHGNPSATVKARATDDSGNLGPQTAGASVAVNCPCSIWGRSMNVPTADRDAGDPSAVEVGMKFHSDKFGMVDGVRFYKSAANTGTHTAACGRRAAQRLAQVTFQNETASGWQTASFDSPVTIQPNTTYVVSYHAPNGRYAGTTDYFWPTPAPGPNGGAIVDSPPLHSVRNQGSTFNGLFSYSATSTFPTSSHAAGNYWVDVVFSPTPPPGTVTSVTATAGGLTSANVGWSAPSSGGTVTTYRITPYIAGVAQTPTTITGSPLPTTTTITGLTNGTTYTFRVEAVNPNGDRARVGALELGHALHGGRAVDPARRLGAAGLAVGARELDAAAVGRRQPDHRLHDHAVHRRDRANAGRRWGLGHQRDRDGPHQRHQLHLPRHGDQWRRHQPSRRVRRGRPAGHAARLHDSDDRGLQRRACGRTRREVHGRPQRLDHRRPLLQGSRQHGYARRLAVDTTGQRLAQATFANETTSGWQSVTFATPVAVTAGTTYVASYFAPNGHYSSTSQGLQSGLDNPPLHALAAPGIGNGVFAYSATSTYPSSTYQATNYFVDVLFAVPAPDQATDVVAAEAGMTSADVEWSAPSSGGPVTSYRITPYVGASPRPSTTVTGTPPVTSKRITGLTTGTTYTFTVEALNANGTGVASAHSNPVTPTGPVAPVKPTDVTAKPGSMSARVSWAAPDSDGDSPITGYTVTPYVGPQAQPSVQVSGSTLATTVPGLRNGGHYTFRVSATNAVGSSPMSTESARSRPNRRSSTSRRQRSSTTATTRPRCSA